MKLSPPPMPFFVIYYCTVHVQATGPRPAGWFDKQRSFAAFMSGRMQHFSATRHVAFLWDLASTATRLEAIAFRLEAIEAIAAFSDALERATCMSH